MSKSTLEAPKDGRVDNITLTGPYGTVPVSLVRQLYSKRQYSYLPFAIYLDSRRKCKDGEWEFNTADIARETAIDRRTVLEIAKAFVSAGLLLSAGKTPKGALKYRLNHYKFERFLNGKLILKSQKLVSAECTPIARYQQTVRPMKSDRSNECPSTQQEPRCRVNDIVVSSNCIFGVQSDDTKISEKISEEDKSRLLRPKLLSKEQVAELVNKHFGHFKSQRASKSSIELSCSSASSSEIALSTDSPPLEMPSEFGLLSIGSQAPCSAITTTSSSTSEGGR